MCMWMKRVPDKSPNNQKNHTHSMMMQTKYIAFWHVHFISLSILHHKNVYIYRRHRRIDFKEFRSLHPHAMPMPMHVNVYMIKHWKWYGNRIDL